MTPYASFVSFCICLLASSASAQGACARRLTPDTPVPVLLDCLAELEVQLQGITSEVFNISRRAAENSRRDDPVFTIEAPMGTIVAWYATEGTVPDGWSICDGTNGTPDLRNKFLQGVGSIADIGDGGGSATHTHSATSSPHGRPGDPNTSASTSLGSDDIWVSLVPHTHQVSVGAASNLPPNFKVIYIMKTR